MISNNIDKLFKLRISRKLTSKLQAIVYLFCIVLIIIVVFSSYKQSFYNWDIDHELYYGQQLIDGNLIWVKEFHDKLPFVQIMFGIASFFGGIQAWRTISWLSVFFTAIIFYFTLPGLIGKLKISHQLKNRISIIFALCYPIWIFILPDDVSHINAIAVSFFTTATLLLLAITESKQTIGKRLLKSLIFISILLYAVAISIRPYYLLPVLVYLFYLSSYGTYSNIFLFFRTTIKRFFGYLFLLIIFGFFLNIFPYIMFKKFKMFITGIEMNLLDWNSNSAIGNIKSSILSRNSFIFWICFFATIFMALALIFKFRRESELLVFHNLAVVGLLLSITLTHWWPHYLTLFCGSFLIINFSILYTIIKNSKKEHYFTRSSYRKICIYFLALFMLMSTNALVKSTVIISRELNQIKPERFEELKTFNKFLYNYDLEGSSFLAPENMYIHWMLKESRHGFPHAAHTYSIVRNLWIENSKLQSYKFPNSLDSYCSLIEKSGINLIVLKDSSVIPSGCFSSSTSRYKLSYKLDIKNNDKSLLIYTVQHY
jgi:hypothetical protein